MSEVIVEYLVEVRGERVKSKDDFYRLANEIASFMTVGAEGLAMPDLNESETKNRLKRSRGVAQIKFFKEESRTGLFSIRLPVENFDLGKFDITLLFGVIAGDALGMPEIKDVQIVGVDVPHEMKTHMKGPRVGLDGIKADLDLGYRPLLAFTVKPRLGLTPKEHARICSAAWRGGVDLAEDDERLVNPSFCPADERVKACLAVAASESQKAGATKLYSVNLTGREDQIVERFEALDKIAREETGAGLRCVKVDVPPVSLGGLVALSEYLHKTGKHVIVTVYPELYWFYRKLLPAGWFLRVLRWCGADVLYAGTPIIFEHFGDKGGVPPSIVTPRLAEVKHDIYEEALWVDDTPKIRRTMPTVTGRVYPVTIDLLYTFLGGNIGLFIGDGILRDPKGVENGARVCRRALDAAVDRRPYTEAFGPEELRQQAELFQSGYVDPRECLRQDQTLRTLVEIPLR